MKKTAHIESGKTPALFTIGSDSYSGTIIESRRNNRELVWKSETGNQNVFTLRKDGKYLLKGGQCGYLTIGDDSPTKLDPGF